MKKTLTIAALAVFVAMKTTAQFFSRPLPSDHVMNSLHVRCIAQDKKGFLWMGSGNGLYRYDGYQYMKMTEGRQPDLLPDESVQDIFNWGDRYLWIRLRGELYSCYDIVNECFADWNGGASNAESFKRHTIVDKHNLWLYDNKHGCCHVTVDDEGRFSAVYFRESDNTLPSSHVTFIMQEKDGKAWIGTDEGLVSTHQGKTRLAVKGKKMVCAQQMADGTLCFISEQGDVYQTHKSGSMNIFTPPAPLPTKVRHVARDHHQLIICTEGDTYCYDTRRHTLTPHPTIHISNAQAVEDNRGNKVVFDYNGTDLWYLTPEKTFHILNIYNKELTQQNGGGRFKFICGSNGYIWISTYGNGLFAYNRATGETTHYTAGQSSNIVESNYLQNLFEDQGGRIWVCQENQGVRHIGSMSQHCDIRFFTTGSDMGHANTVRLIAPIGDKLWVANRNNDLWTLDQQINILTKDNPYKSDVVAATTDKQGHLWVGTRNQGIFVDGKPLEPAIKGKVSDILCDHKGRIWISIFDGSVVLVKPQEGGSMQVDYFFQLEHAIAQPRSMVEDKQGRIWLCSNRGVYYFQPEKLQKDASAYQHINVSGANSNSDEVHCLFIDSRQRIWAGTTGHGLALISEGGTVSHLYTDKDGLPNNSIESIVEDQQGHLWVGTYYGLGRYMEADDRFNTFFLSDTPLGLMYTEGCATVLKDGRIAMGTLHGMQLFNPKDINPRSSIYKLELTDLHINGIPLRNIEDGDAISSITREHKLSLSHDQNSLTFYFSSFEYINPRIIKYSYMLEGYDKDWSVPSAQNFATYKNLRPGKYTLHIRSYNIFGVQNELVQELSVIIRQPWWNTWWAWLFYLFFLGAFCWTIWRQWRHTEELRMKISLENQLTEYKLRFFTNISHEFRTPLTIIRGAMDRISAQGDIPGKLKMPINSMQKSTDRLLRLVNELLEFRKIQNQKLRLQLEETDIIDFLRNIFLTFSETAENRQMSYQFTTFAREYKMFIDRNFVDKMAYNLLSNAFKYTTRKQSITMRVTLQDDRLCFEVEDTGIGIPKEKQASLFTRFDQSAFSRDSIGIGLHMVSELVRVHHGTITFRENTAPDTGQAATDAPGGSIFTITLPTNKSVYNESDFLVAGNSLLTDDSGSSQRPAATTYKEIASPPLNDRRVLIVDDDDDLREHISTELRRYFLVSTAENGEEALQQIQAERPDLIVSDVKMPVMNGFELIKKIRQDETLSDLPVILLTAIADEEKQIKGTEYGADDYLFKPFNMKMLVAKCSTLIAQRDKLRVKYAKEVVGSTPIADIIVEDADKKFLERFESWVYNHLDKPDMQAMDFANSMKMGRTTFFKKVKQVTGMPPHEYIKKMRMMQAAELLKDPTNSVSEVAYKIGFDDPNYFSRKFKEYFGITATQFKRGKELTPPKETAAAEGQSK